MRVTFSDDVIAEQQPVGKGTEHCVGTSDHRFRAAGDSVERVNDSFRTVILIDQVHAAGLPYLEGDAKDVVDEVIVGAVSAR